MKSCVVKCLFITGLFLCSLSGAYGQGANPDWNVFSLSKIKAEASFPCKPKETTLRGERTSFRFDYRCTNDGTELSVSLTKYSEYFKADAAVIVVDEVEKGLRALGKDVVVVRTQINVQAFPATVLEARSETSLRKYIFVKLKRGHLGAVVWQTRKAGQSSEDFAAKFGSAWQKFADSFKILSAK